jgi:geranylgeranyl pyrophosphate synthase
MRKKSDKKLIEQAKEILAKRGQKAFEIAKNVILNEKFLGETVYNALHYFMNESWYDVQHPALISLACEAVGGDSDAATNIGASIVLLAGACDIHDDIIDKSKAKGCKLTVFGKFGEDIAIIAGDTLFINGLTFLFKACEEFPRQRRKIILSLINQAFIEIGEAEARETKFKGKYDISPEKYYDVIEMKASVAEAMARIGAIIGGGTIKKINALGHYGRTLGILMTIRDEFIDLLEEELRNRIKNECLPLPLLYAFQNKNIRNEIIPLLKIYDKKNILKKVAKKVIRTQEVAELKKKLQAMVDKEIAKLYFINKSEIRSELELLLNSTIEDI